MMDIIKSENSKYDQYESLLLEKDQLLKEAGQIWTCYLQMFGQLISDNFEDKIECIKCKKTIAYYQNALNHGGRVDAAEMQKYLDREMAEYYEQLTQMIKENETAKNAGTSSPYEVKRSKELYRKLAKLIHPDINPETAGSEILLDLWDRIVKAYHMNDVKALSELDVLVRKALKDLGSESAAAEIPDIEYRIEELKEEIEQIKSTEPYTLKIYVEDEDEAQAKKTGLEEELEAYRRYHKELNAVILQMMQGGGLQIYVD